MANKLARRYDYEGLDFTKFMAHFERGLLQELDFKQEVINSERLRDAFRGYKALYLPKMYVLESSPRSIIMEYVEGEKINDIETLKEIFGDATKVTDVLVDIYARMIFLHGHVHCDAHPGNMMVRCRDGKPEICLIDHGFYCSTGEDFRKQFCELWYAMASMDYSEMKRLAYKMGIGEYFRYLPLLFTYRTINTTKPLGGKLAPEEKTFMVDNDEINLDKVGMLLQKLPTDVVFIFKAMHMAGLHNFRAGGTTRTRLFNFTDYAI